MNIHPDDEAVSTSEKTIYSQLVYMSQHPRSISFFRYSLCLPTLAHNSAKACGISDIRFKIRLFCSLEIALETNWIEG
jgi:hypothetical protein